MTLSISYQRKILILPNIKKFHRKMLAIILPPLLKEQRNILSLMNMLEEWCFGDLPSFNVRHIPKCCLLIKLIPSITSQRKFASSVNQELIW